MVLAMESLEGAQAWVLLAAWIAATIFLIGMIVYQRIQIRKLHSMLNRGRRVTPPANDKEAPGSRSP